MQRRLLEAICMSKKEFVGEHKKLLRVLKNPTKDNLRAEHKEQQRELRQKIGRKKHECDD